MAKFCNNCGEKLKSGELYCSNCGKSVENEIVVENKKEVSREVNVLF